MQFQAAAPCPAQHAADADRRARAQRLYLRKTRRVGVIDDLNALLDRPVVKVDKPVCTLPSVVADPALQPDGCVDTGGGIGVYFAQVDILHYIHLLYFYRCILVLCPSAPG